MAAAERHPEQHLPWEQSRRLAAVAEAAGREVVAAEAAVGLAERPPGHRTGRNRLPMLQHSDQQLICLGLVVPAEDRAVGRAPFRATVARSWVAVASFPVTEGAGPAGPRKGTVEALAVVTAVGASADEEGLLEGLVVHRDFRPLEGHPQVLVDHPFRLDDPVVRGSLDCLVEAAVQPFHVSDEQHAGSDLAIPESGTASRVDCVTAPASTPRVHRICDLCHAPSLHLFQ